MLVPTFRVKVKLTNVVELAVVVLDISPGSRTLFPLTSMNHVWGALSMLLYSIVTVSPSVTLINGAGVVWFQFREALPLSQNVR
jgi:hypothetical protein